MPKTGLRPSARGTITPAFGGGKGMDAQGGRPNVKKFIGAVVGHADVSAANLMPVVAPVFGDSLPQDPRR